MTPTPKYGGGGGVVPLPSIVSRPLYLPHATCVDEHHDVSVSGGEGVKEGGGLRREGGIGDAAGPRQLPQEHRPPRRLDGTVEGFQCRQHRFQLQQTLLQHLRLVRQRLGGGERR